MLDALLIFAVFCACLGAFRRDGERVAFNVPALALLASVAVTSAFVWLGAPFNIVLWLLIDFLVIAAIASRKLTLADTIILALFIPAWVLYAKPDALAHGATTAIVAAQLLLTFPIANVWKRLKSRRHVPDRWDDFDMRAIETGG